MRSERVSVNGIELAFEERGHGGTRPLVLVHGFTGSRSDFAPRLPALAELGRTVALDLRGHGESTNTGDAASYTLERLADDLLGFLAALDIESCDLLGHSMGGMVALRAALAGPERVASLVLMDTAARAPDMPAELLDVAKRVVASGGLEALAAALRARGHDDPARTAADRRLEAEWGEGYWSEWRLPNFRAMDAAAYGALGDAIFAQGRLDARLEAIRCPTLVMVGAGDDAFRAPAEELAKAIPAARLTTLPGAGHQPQLETPEPWLQAIREHLAQVRAAARFPSR